ncbi:MAG: alpha/beta hydrolase [Microbacterium sp.]|jgi:pimeloyl-ACP methyl ester carboxylesterase|uniref:Alpha/beta hydrolase n=1 Tax=Microbacterium ginsengisoli TaxID=400772 RepID=A0A0F0LWE5_9MICO|nr:alpha/beta fold hydrolase [Microbacterium ginsengisoli]KJL35701.1 putative aminoacrylate hydrolase RutD [Microbacterium ginsengisoli]MAL05443.1 alpha/beta hydrolase [Microbacterium sp.]MBN9209810.1 alpha/beta fold hydrolase [Microbacterium ginsengisoli]HAN23626.1 alpha/beta hydrolase [Microbacterium ginsengisoli]
MASSRRAASRGASPAVSLGLRTLIVALGVLLGLSLAAIAGVAGRIARLVVTPSRRRPDTTIVALDPAAQTITLTRTPDTELPGRYGLFTTGAEEYLKLGSVLQADAGTVKRKLLTEVPTGTQLADPAAFSGWYYDRPEQLHLPYRSTLIGSAVGPCPAWIFPADGGSDVWCIQIHGRGAARAECLRAVPLLHSLGITTMVTSYRNDGEAPRSRTGTYMLGATEWRDVDAAVGYARRHGAERIILMGWSMGGAIALQLELSSAHRDRIVGVILESPVVDWRIVLRYQGREMGLPEPVTELALTALQSEWGAALTRSGAPIPFDRLDVVARAEELRHPILILHSDDDGFVPSEASHQLAEARPDLVDLQVFAVARHTKLWNYDQERWSRAIESWLDAHALIPRDAGADT